MSRRYRGYRGRRSGGGIITLLCVLCIAAAAISLFLHRNLVYTPEGMELRMPFGMDSIRISTDAPQDEEVNLIIEDEENAPSEEPPEAPAEVQDAAPTEAVFLPLDTVLSDPAAADALISRMQASRVNTLLIEVKAEDGRLAFISASPAAANSNPASDAQLKSILEKAQAAGITTLAQVSCFRDNLATRAKRSLAVKTNTDLVWLDPQEIRWLDPYQPGTSEYLCTLLGELYDLGFKEVLLTRLHFPVNGRQSLIKYTGTDKAWAIGKVISELSAVAAAKGGAISAVYENHAPSETEPLPGGQDINLFAESFKHVCTRIDRVQNGRGADVELIDKMLTSIGDGAEKKFLPLLDISKITDPAELNDYIYTAKSKNTGCIFFSTASYPDRVFEKPVS